MAYLLNWRLWVLAAFVALIPITYFKGRKDERKIVMAEVTAAKAQADAEARRLEIARQSRVDQAARVAAAARSRLAADYARTRDQLDGMRGTLDAVERASKESHDAAAKSVAALRTVYESCTAALARVGTEAQGHANDSLMYQRSWSK